MLPRTMSSEPARRKHHGVKQCNRSGLVHRGSGATQVASFAVKGMRQKLKREIYSVFVSVRDRRGSSPHTVHTPCTHGTFVTRTLSLEACPSNTADNDTEQFALCAVSVILMTFPSGGSQCGTFFTVTHGDSSMQRSNGLASETDSNRLGCDDVERRAL